MSVFVTGAGVVPSLGMPISDLVEGSIVMLNENGSPVPFYVAEQDYESGLNGSGRTLMVRKDIYYNRAWHTNATNKYATSAIDTWLNGTYKTKLDSAIQTAIDTTVFYYTPMGGDTTVTTLERSVFLLSVNELDKYNSGLSINQEGTVLSIASTLQVAYYDGSATGQWTRTPRTNVTNRVCVISANGTIGNNVNPYGTSYGTRPCFTLPASVIIDPKPNEDGSYNLKI